MQNALLSPYNFHGKFGRPFRPLQQDTGTSAFRKARPCALLHKRCSNPRLRQRSSVITKADDGQEQQPQDSSDKEGASGSNDLPGSRKSLQLPREVIQRLRDVIFGFDFFVTSVENYQANGVLFKGNLRADPSDGYDRIAARLKHHFSATAMPPPDPPKEFPIKCIRISYRGELGEDYVLYLLEDQEEKPIAVVLPKNAAEQPLPAVQEIGLSVLFGLATLGTTLNANGVLLLQPDQLDLSPGNVLSALPGTLIFLALLGVHEVGHGVAAKQRGVQLGRPFFVPAGLGFLGMNEALPFAGSFGAITSFGSTLADRAALLQISAYGPAFGSAAALAAVVIGLGLSAVGIGGSEMQPVAFNDSLLVGILGQLALGSKLAAGGPLPLNPFVTAGWAALLANALNCIPIGVLDGGRIAHGLWGRRNAGRLNIITLFVLGVAGIFNTLALFWVLLVVFLQRGPIAPQREELSQPESEFDRRLGIGLLVFSLLVLLPYPGAITPDLQTL